MNINDFTVEVCKSFSQTIQARKFEPVAAFCSAKASCPFSQAEEMSSLLHNFCREGVRRDLAALCEEMGLVVPDSPNVIEGDTPAASDAAFQAQARKNSKAEQARVAEEKIKELRANGAQINDLEDSSAVQAGQSSEIASHPEGDTWIETQEAPSEPSHDGDQPDPSVQAGQSPSLPIPFVGTINPETGQITVDPKLVKGQRGRPRKPRPGTVDELEVSKAQKVTGTPPAYVETPGKAYQATAEDVPPAIANAPGPTPVPDQIMQLRQAASDLVMATGVTALEARETIWRFLVASSGVARTTPDAPVYAAQAACLPGIVALIPQRDAEAVLFSTRPTEFGKSWRASYDKLRAQSSKMTEQQWAKALTLAVEKYPTAPGDALEFMEVHG